MKLRVPRFRPFNLEGAILFTFLIGSFVLGWLRQHPDLAPFATPSVILVGAVCGWIIMDAYRARVNGDDDDAPRGPR